MGAGPPGEYGGALPDEDFEPDACEFEDPSDVTSMWRPSGQYWRGDACGGRYDHGRHPRGASRDFDRLAGIACAVRLVAGESSWAEDVWSSQEHVSKLKLVTIINAKHVIIINSGQPTTQACTDVVCIIILMLEVCTKISNIAYADASWTRRRSFCSRLVRTLSFDD